MKKVFFIAFILLGVIAAMPALAAHDPNTTDASCPSTWVPQYGVTCSDPARSAACGVSGGIPRCIPAASVPTGECIGGTLRVNCDVCTASCVCSGSELVCSGGSPSLFGTCTERNECALAGRESSNLCTGACGRCQDGFVDLTPADTSDPCVAERPPITLAPFAADTDTTTVPSIWVNKTAAGNLVQLQDNGGDRFIIERDGDLRIIGAATGGDIYLNDGKALRIDATGASALNLGNYDSGAGDFHLTLLAGADSLADLILRKGDSDRWALAVESGAAATQDHDFEIRRFRAADVNPWTTLFSLDYDTGNITLLDGATIGGVDLTDVITQPATCDPDQVLQWSGTAWTCAEQTGGTTYAAAPNANIAINTTVTPNTIGVVSSPTFSGLTVRGGVTIDDPVGIARLTVEQIEVTNAGTALHVAGTSLFSGNIIASATIRGNFVSSTGASCTGDQILQRSADGATWTCVALPAAGITVEADPTFATWRGSDVGAQSLSRLTISGGLTIGANAVVSGDLRVNRNSTIDGTLSALSVTATEDVSGRDLIASRDARVTGTGTFDGAVTVNNDLTIANGGNITLDANREIQLSAPSVGVGNRLNIDGETGAGGGVALRIISPGTENISEILLNQRGSEGNLYDRWALSTRAGSSNFEIWRNNGGWIPDLQIDYNTGRVTLQHSPLIVSSIQSSIGTLSIDSLLSVQSTSDSGSNRINRPVHIGTNSLGLGPLRGDDALIEGNALYDGLHIDDYLMRLNTFGEGAVTPRFTVNRAGNIVATGSITARGSVFSEGILRASAGAHLAGGTTTIVGGLTADTATMDSLTISTSATIRGRLNVDGGATVGTLTASSANVTGALDVGGIIRAGTGTAAQPNGVQITSAGGGLKMAELANEDWDGASAFGNERGWLVILKNGGSATCATVCGNHGLRCHEARELTMRSTECTEVTGLTLFCMCGR